MDFTALGLAVLVPVGRSVAGWLQNSLEDGKIDKFEWGKLGETIVRVGVIATGTFVGLQGLGVDISVVGAAAGAMVLDIILRKIEKIGNNN